MHVLIRHQPGTVKEMNERIWPGNKRTSVRSFLGTFMLDLFSNALYAESLLTFIKADDITVKK